MARSVYRHPPPPEKPDTEGLRRSLRKRGRKKRNHGDGAGPSKIAKKAKAARNGNDSAPLLDPKSKDLRDQCVLMLMLEETIKDLLVRIIFSGVYVDLMTADGTCVNVFAFLLGMPAGHRGWSMAELYKRLPRAADGTPIVPERALELFNIQRAKDKELYPTAAAKRPLKAFWELTNDDFMHAGHIRRSLDFSSSFEHVLKAMTLEELQQYWAWHLDMI